MKFLLDEHVPKAVAIALRQRNIDAVTIQEVGRKGRKDNEQLLYALSVQRVLVTYDKDFLRIAANGVEHAGIVFCTTNMRGIGEIVQELLILHEVVDESEMKNMVEFL